MPSPGVVRPRRSAGPWAGGRAILPGPCASSRSGSSRDPTSTGSSRWSRSRSPSGGAGPGTASAQPGRARARPPRRATVPAARLAGRAWPRVAGLGPAPPRPTTARAAAALAVHRSSRPGPLDRHLAVGRRRAGAGDRRGRARARRAGRLAGPPGPPDGRPGRASSRAGRRGSARRRATPPPLDPRRRPADPDHLDQRDERQEHRHPADHPHPRSWPGATSGRRPRTGSSSTSGWSSPATGPGPAARTQILGASDVDVAVLETARGGIVLRGVGYESNDASILTNVSSDHLDLQGIHTLPELAEVKATICRITRPDGWVVLNADDPLVARGRPAGPGPGRLLLARRASARRRSGATWPRGGRAYVVRRGELVEVDGRRVGRRSSPIARDPDHARRAGPPQRRQRARRGRRRPGAGRHDRARSPTGLRDFRPTRRALAGPAQPVPARRRAIVIVDFAHNEAGVERAPRRRRGDRRRRRPAGRRRSRSIIGTAGDRPDDTLRGIGRHRRASGPSAWRSRRRSSYLRGRTARVGRRASCGPGGRGRRRSADDVPVYETETAALRAELNGAGGGGRGARRPARTRPGSSSSCATRTAPGVYRAPRRARRPAGRLARPPSSSWLRPRTAAARIARVAESRGGLNAEIAAAASRLRPAHA